MEVSESISGTRSRIWPTLMILTRLMTMMAVGWMMGAVMEAAIVDETAKVQAWKVRIEMLARMTTVSADVVVLSGVGVMLAAASLVDEFVMFP